MNTIQKILSLFFVCGNLLFAGEVPVKKQERLSISQLQESRHVKEIIQEIQSVVLTETTIPIDIAIVEKLFSIPLPELSSTRLFLIAEESRKEAETCNTGLKLTARYRFNQKTDFLEDETAPYRWRAYMGLEWDILRNGLLEQKRIKQSLEANLNAERKLFNLKLKEEKYPFLRTVIIYLFNQAKKEKLREEVLFLSQYLEVLAKI